MADTQPIPFSLFILSLSASAEIHLGTMPPPGQKEPGPPNLQEASHLIEVLAMLETKTKGNLDESEQQLLSAVLYDLRMRYVAAARGEKRIVEP